MTDPDRGLRTHQGARAEYLDTLGDRYVKHDRCERRIVVSDPDSAATAPAAPDYSAD